MYNTMRKKRMNPKSLKYEMVKNGNSKVPLNVWKLYFARKWNYPV